MPSPRKTPKIITQGATQKVRVQGRMAAFIKGELDVEDLDDEELARGRFRDKNGGFTGRPPLLIPREFHDAIVREMLTRGEAKMRSEYWAAMETFIDIARNPMAKDSDRLKAAQYIWERFQGKLPDRVEIKASIEPWQEDVRGIVADVDD